MVGISGYYYISRWQFRCRWLYEIVIMQLWQPSRKSEILGQEPVVHSLQPVICLSINRSISTLKFRMGSDNSVAQNWLESR
jgi:hypothetical protein